MNILNVNPVNRNASVTYPKNNLLYGGERGMNRHRITCEVTVDFAENPDQTAIQDVLSMLVKETVRPAYRRGDYHEKSHLPLPRFHCRAGGPR